MSVSSVQLHAFGRGGRPVGAVNSGTLNGDVVIGVGTTGDGSVAVFGSGADASSLIVDDNLFVGDVGRGTLRIGQDLAGNRLHRSAVLDGDITIGRNVANTLHNRMVVACASATASSANIFVGQGAKGELDVLNEVTLNANNIAVGVESQGSLQILNERKHRRIGRPADQPA